MTYEGKRKENPHTKTFGGSRESAPRYEGRPCIETGVQTKFREQPHERGVFSKNAPRTSFKNEHHGQSVSEEPPLILSILVGPLIVLSAPFVGGVGLAFALDLVSDFSLSATFQTIGDRVASAPAGAEVSSLDIIANTPLSDVILALAVIGFSVSAFFLLVSLGKRVVGAPPRHKSFWQEEIEREEMYRLK